MMKKLLIIAAVASVALASCTKTVPVVYDDGKDVAISFSPISQRVGTKANVFGEQSATYSATNPSTGKYEDFAAWAYYTEDVHTNTNPQGDGGYVFFGTNSAGVACVHNDPVSGAGTDYWAPTTPYYWPRTGYLHFHAMSPADFGTGNLAHAWASGISITGYVAPQYTDGDTTIGQTADNQIDLMYSDFEFDNQRSQYNASTNVGKYDDEEDDGIYKHDGVNLLFRHALSLVQFKVKTEADYKSTSLKHEFYVRKIEVLNAYKTGNFFENRKSDCSNGYNAVADMTGKIGFTPDNADNSQTPYWTAFSNEVTLTPYNTTTVAAWDNSIEATSALSEPKGTTLIALPQPLGNHDHAPAPSTNVQVKVTYDYRFSADDGSHWTTATDQEITVDLSGAKGTYSGTPGEYTVNNWLINHKYVYTLVFKLDPIIFDPAVAPFVEVSAIGVDLPTQI